MLHFTGIPDWRRNHGWGMVESDQIPMSNNPLVRTQIPRMATIDQKGILASNSTQQRTYPSARQNSKMQRDPRAEPIINSINVTLEPMVRQTKSTASSVTPRIATVANVLNAILGLRSTVSSPEAGSASPALFVIPSLTSSDTGDFLGGEFWMITSWSTMLPPHKRSSASFSTPSDSCFSAPKTMVASPSSSFWTNFSTS
mmetsp:Transcript_21198/g.34169  ORF Transcript_21198/g.34169 Transcript_21198/m.34169 type:complete len:200 (-) Transcript_21198:605-1204(-)